MEKIEEYISFLKAQYNLVLTGAPGTGKTFLARAIAQAMGAEFEMAQFHPSYDYTDFVEGLRPVEQDGKIVFEHRDGIFKQFCKRALQWRENKAGVILERCCQDIDKAEGKKINIDSSGEALSLTGDAKTSKGLCLNSSDGAHVAEKVHVLNALQHLLNITDNDNLGNAWPEYRIARRIEELYSKEFDSPMPYVFLIDEINRGEIAKIFGELFFSLDPGYRGVKGRITTQYQDLLAREDPFAKGFYVPDNVYIIASMNDIDRSVESMDFAMRRRFAFCDVSAKDSGLILDSENAWKKKKPPEQMLEEIKNRMNNLNAAIVDDYAREDKDRMSINLSEDYQIGAAYFLKYELYNNFDILWQRHLQGLLGEYLRGQPKVEEKLDWLKKAYNDGSAQSRS